MKIKSDDEISLFVRDEQTGRFMFNARALQALGLNPMQAKQRGYFVEELSERSATAPSSNAPTNPHTPQPPQ